MTTSITVQTLREMVQNLSARKPELASRAERAAQIVATRDIRQDANGQWHVESQSKPGSFHLVNAVGTKACDCVDFTRKAAPNGWCKHLIAVALIEKGPQGNTDKTQTGGAKATAAQLERRGQEFHRLVQKGYPIMSALQHARGVTTSLGGKGDGGQRANRSHHRQVAHGVPLLAFAGRRRSRHPLLAGGLRGPGGVPTA